MVLLAKQYTLQDYLEPGEKGLVILTNHPNPADFSRELRPNARLFLWMIQRPRKVFQNIDSLRWLTVHNGELFAQYSPDNIWLNNCFRNIRTGEILVPREEHSYGNSHYCSHDGELFFVKEEWTKDRYIWTGRGGYEHIRDYTDSFFYKWKNENKEEIVKKRAKVVKVLDSENGILASMMPEPRGDGDNFIQNIINNEIVYNEPKRYDGTDLGQIRAMCFIGDRLVFDRYPHGIWDLEGERIVREEVGKLEMMAARNLGYSYEKAMGAESSSWRNPWKEARRLKNDAEGLHRRIALEKFAEHRFEINHMIGFNNHLILASCQNLYAIPVSRLTENAVIDPEKNKLWTFQDNISGIVVVEGEELKRLKRHTSVRSGKKSSSGTVPQLFRAVA